jgi:hypothetical protein
LSVAFTAPTYDGGSPIINYQYYYSHDGTNFILNTVGTTSPITITGLTNGRLYDVYLRAVNNNGTAGSIANSQGTPAPESWKVDSKTKLYEKGDVAVIGDGLVNGNVKERIPKPSTLIHINDRKYVLSRFGFNFTSTDFIQIAQSSENKNTWYIKLLDDGDEFAKKNGGFAFGVPVPAYWNGFLKLENSNLSIGVYISSVMEVPVFKPEQPWLIPFPFHGKKLNVTFTTVP